MAEEAFDLAEVSLPKIDGMRRAKIRTNFYSAPVLVGLEVEAKTYASHVEIWHEGQLVARHERCYIRLQEVLDLEHYLKPQEHKPGALAGSKPLEQWRKKGRRPASFDEIWTQLMIRNGKQNGTRRMIELLQPGKIDGYKKLRQDVEPSLAMGSCNVSTVQYLMTAEQLDRARPEPIEIGALSCYERPLPVMADCDQLLACPELMP